MASALSPRRWRASRSRAVSLAIAAVFGIAVGGAALAQAPTGAPPKLFALTDVVRFIENGRYGAGFSAALNLRNEDGRAYVRWAEERALKQPAAFLMPLARHAFARDPDKALKWFYFARLRLLIDMTRCEAGDAPAGLFLVVRAVEEAVPEIERHPGRAAAWRWALDHDARHPVAALPGEDCLILENLGRAMQGAARGIKPNEVRLLDKVSMKPESEWPKAGDGVRASFERTQRMLAGEPADRPASAPQVKKSVAPTAPKAGQRTPDVPEAPPDPAAQAEARRLETQHYPDPPEPPVPHGKPGKFGPVPTGLPGDPFHITEARGDGWRMFDAGPGLFSRGAAYYWLDAKRVFFGASNRPYHVTPEEQEKYKFRSWYLIWDTETGEIRHHSDIPVVSAGPDYCYAGGQIKITRELIWATVGLGKQQQVTHRRWLAGPVGQEKELVEPTREGPSHDDQYRWAPTDCRYVRTPAQLRRREWAPLREGDGYLDFEPSGPIQNFFGMQKTPPEQQQKIHLRRFSPDEDIELPIGVWQVTATCVRYFAFKDAYFLHDCLSIQEEKVGTHYHLNKFNCLPAWWLWRDGRTERMCIPSGPWNSGSSFSVIPTARGLFISTVRDGEMRKPKYAGGYLVKDGQIKKLVSGVIPGAIKEKINVSADGCRLAFSIAPNFNALDNRTLGPITVRVLDVCADGDSLKTDKGG